MGFGKLCWTHWLGVTCKDRSNVLGPDWGQVWPFWAVLVSGSYSTASCGKVGGPWGQVGLSGGHVAKLGYVMSCWSYMSDFVRPCCWFCIPKCSPPSRTKILSGFLPAMLLHWGVKYGYLVAMLALLAPSWINFGHLGVHGDAMWDQFRGYNFGIAKNHPKLYLQNALPMALEA